MNYDAAMTDAIFFQPERQSAFSKALNRNKLIAVAQLGGFASGSEEKLAKLYQISVFKH